MNTNLLSFAMLSATFALASTAARAQSAPIRANNPAPAATDAKDAVVLDEFKVFDKRAKHPDWMRQAEPVVRRVSDVWRQAGVNFPLHEVMEAW